MKKNKFISFAMALMLLISPASFSNTAYAASDNETVSISTLNDLLLLSENCSIDSYSRGKTFSLENDISLEDTWFDPIPVFAGTFLGNGHTISGLRIADESSGMGFFMLLEYDGVVENLNVQGNFEPSDAQKDIGGIAGKNRGRITSCTFYGSITANENAGGIAGINEESGIIEYCSNHAVITGNYMTGGLTGQNRGTVTSCENHGSVNSSDKTADSGSNSLSFSLDSEDRDAVLRTEKVNDAGGIAGNSSGTISDCMNYASIGYKNSGYNIGGIAGRQNGCISGCINHGTVMGRKDVGGITGQFEPYIVILYSEDTILKIREQSDQIEKTMDSIRDTAKASGDTADSQLDSIDQAMSNLKGSLRGYKDYYKQELRDFTPKLDADIDNIMNSMDGLDVESGLAENDIRNLKQEIENLKGLTAELAAEAGSGNEPEILEAILNSLDNISSLSKSSITDTADNVEGNIFQIHETLTDIQNQSEEMKTLIRDNRDSFRTDSDATDTDVTAQLDAIYDLKDQLSDTADGTRSDLRSQMDTLKSQLDALENTIRSDSDRTREDIDHYANDEDIYDDLSDDSSLENAMGKIISCENHGRITGNNNAGGITGTIGIEATLDPESDTDTVGTWTLNMSRNVTATVIASVNRGYVTADHNYAGGIAGKTDAGALLENENYGDIETINGDFAGGIAGYAGFTLRGNYELGEVTGNDYTGGIAGECENLYDNCSVAIISSDRRGKTGAVAGKAKGEISGNTYVHDGLGAVSGITLEKEARSISYNQLLQMNELPAGMKQLHIDFYVGSQIIKSVSCNYGDSMEDVIYPQIENNEISYYQWDYEDLSNIRKNIRVYGSYQPWTTAIDSGGTDCILLVEGAFHPLTTLWCKDADAYNCPIPAGTKLSGAYNFEINRPLGTVAVTENYRVHVLAGEADDHAVIMTENEDGTWSSVPAALNGSYLIFNTDHEGKFAVFIPAKNHTGYIILFSVFAVLVAAGILFFIKKKKKK